MFDFLSTGVRYIRPQSLTWWAGLALIGLGFANAMSPFVLIALGLVVIGMRDKLERMGSWEDLINHKKE